MARVIAAEHTIRTRPSRRRRRPAGRQHPASHPRLVPSRSGGGFRSRRDSAWSVAVRRPGCERQRRGTPHPVTLAARARVSAGARGPVSRDRRVTKLISAHVRKTRLASPLKPTPADVPSRSLSVSSGGRPPGGGHRPRPSARDAIAPGVPGWPRTRAQPPTYSSPSRSATAARPSGSTRVSMRYPKSRPGTLAKIPCGPRTIRPVPTS
jgi:hypothetical protein